MSSEPQTNTDVTGHEECTACGTTLPEQRLALQSYPESAEATLSMLSAGGLLYCPECGTEPAKLLDSWTSHNRPPIDGDRRIGAGYRESAEQCSFCTDKLGSNPVVGVELYRRPSESLPTYANYTLCNSCRTVFEEFLQNVSRQ